MKAMAKDPEDRYQSAAELRDDLIRFRQGQPVPRPAVSGAPATRAVAGPPPLTRPVRPDLCPAGDPARRIRWGPFTRRLATEPTPAALPGRLVGGPVRRPAGRARVLVYFIGQNANWWGTPATIPVPYVKSDPEAQAQSILKRRGSSTSIQDGPSGLVPHGQVIGTTPGAGSAVPPNHTITLNVSTGAP